MPVSNMSDQRKPPSAHSSDWVSYSSGSSRDASDGVDSSAGLLSTLKRNSWLTSYSTYRRSIFSPRNTNRKGGLHGGELRPAPAAAPVDLRLQICAPGAGSPLQISRLSQPLALRSQLSTTTQAPSFAPPHRDRNSQPRDPSSSLSKIHGFQHDDHLQTSQIYLLPSPSLTLPPLLPRADVWSDVARMDPNNPTQSPNLADLLTSLSSQEDASRKMAAFKLQSLINDPSFAEHFVVAGGLPRLRTLILEANGNTLAYSLASFARLLEVDQGWEAVNDQVIEKASFLRLTRERK